MLNKKLMAVTAATMILASTASIFASGWQKNDKGWWFGTNDTNTTWHAGGWQWIDGNNDGIAECYYFDKDGYVLTNTTTPDGYQVDADGAWTINGVIQTQNVSSTGNIAATDITWPVVTSQDNDDWFTKYLSNSDFCAKVASQFIFDNGGYNEWGISNAAVDMLTHTREENKKYGELFIMEENPEGFDEGARITYKNGITVYYNHTRKEKRKVCTATILLEDNHYPILNDKKDYLYIGASDKERIVTDQKFTFDGKTYKVIAGYGQLYGG